MLVSLIVNQLQVDQCYERNVYFSVLLEIINTLDSDYFFFLIELHPVSKLFNGLPDRYYAKQGYLATVTSTGCILKRAEQ